MGTYGDDGDQKRCNGEEEGGYDDGGDQRKFSGEMTW